MTNSTRIFPAHDIKQGDVIEGREVLDVIDTFRRKVAVLFTDDSRFVVNSWTTLVEIDN